jgi:glycosyltransferase involved in cell wall biosynthesis
MRKTNLSILQISPSDGGGGAELTALSLFLAYQDAGYDSYLLVDRKQGGNSSIIEIDNDAYRNAWVRFWSRAVAYYDRQSIRIRGLGLLLRSIQKLGELQRNYRTRQGYEQTDFPGTSVAIDSLVNDVDLVHCHNLHGNYFDLRELESVSAKLPLVLSMHDAWLLSGHCAFSFGCDRWKTGCGRCPDLNLFPAIEKDKTSENWAAKKKIFSNTKFHLITPSQWLMDKAKASLLTGSILSHTVIPNGVDTTIFYPRDKGSVRQQLGISADTKVLMIAASGLVDNPWKDFATLRAALAKLSGDVNVIVLAVGHAGDDEKIGNVTIKFMPFERNAHRMADYYSASDIYVHCAKVEVFATVTIEARACAVPVIASAVGGIPEHLKGLDCPGSAAQTKHFDETQADGVLCPQGDSDAVSKAIEHLLDNDQLRSRLGNNGVKNVTENFTYTQQVERHLALYEKIIAGRNK